MALTLTAAEDPALHAIRLAFTATSPQHRFNLTRPDPNKSGAVVWILHNEVLPASMEAVDFVAPYNTDLHYTLTDISGVSGGTATATAHVDFVGSTQPPVFNTNVGDWPVLRAPLEINLGMFRIPVMSYSADFNMRAIRHSILSSRIPVISSDETELKTGTMTWATSDAATRSRMLEMVSDATHILHIRAPCVSGLGDLCFVVMDLQETAPLQGHPDYRVWTVQWAQVPLPNPADWAIPPVVGRWTWKDVNQYVDNYAELNAHFKSWYEVSLQLSGLTVAQHAHIPEADAYIGSI